VIDKVRGKLLVVAENGASSSTPVLFECNLDGSTCTNRDLSAGQGPNSGLTPSVVIDPASATLLAVTPNTSLGLFATCLR
jgi:hypothetical protein